MDTGGMVWFWLVDLRLNREKWSGYEWYRGWEPRKGTGQNRWIEPRATDWAGFETESSTVHLFQGGAGLVLGGARRTKVGVGQVEMICLGI